MGDVFVVTDNPTLGSVSGSPMRPIEHYPTDHSIPLPAMRIADVVRGFGAGSFVSSIAIITQSN